MKLFAALLGSLLMYSTTSYASNVVFPGDYINEDAPNQNFLPFTPYATSFQQIYDASIFGSQPITISGIAFRSDSGPSAGNYDPFLAPQYGISASLSTSRTSVSSFSTVFRDNFGSDAIDVFTGPITFALKGNRVGEETNYFDVIIPFERSFLYNPEKGDLLLQIVTQGGYPIAGLDAVSFSAGSRRTWVDGTAGVNSVGYTTDAYTIVTQFMISPVPEPATWMTLIGGFGIIGWTMRRGKLAVTA